MAFENFPSTAKEQELMTPPKFNWMTLVAGFLFVGLSFAVGYILWYKNQTIQTIQDKIMQDKAVLVTNNSVVQQNELQKELNDVTDRYNKLKTLDIQKDSANWLLNKQIIEKRDSIYILLKNDNVSQTNLIKAKTLITSLKNNIEGYKTNIEKITGEKVVVMQHEQAVEKQRDIMQANLDSANTIIKQKEDSIDIGFTINALNFSILSIDQRNNGKEKETSVARKVDKLRISFELGENRLASSGIKELFVCVSDPGGSPIAVEALGSGKFFTREGVEKFYTEKLNFDYIEGSSHQIISFDWKQNTNFEPGDYKIEVYNNGFKIGEGVRHLK